MELNYSKEANILRRWVVGLKLRLNIEITRYLQHPLSKWLFQLDDSKSSHEKWGGETMTIHQEKRLLFTVPGKKSRIELVGTVVKKLDHPTNAETREKYIMPHAKARAIFRFWKKASSVKQERLGGLGPMSFLVISQHFIGFMGPRIPWSYHPVIRLLPSYV